MNSYFPNPFLSPLQGEGQGTPGGIQCNFGGLTGRYDQQTGQSFLCANQGISSQYGSTPSPNHHHMTAAGDPSACPRSTEINGYDTPNHVSHVANPASWTAQGNGLTTTDYTSHNTTTCTENNSQSTSSSHSQAVPFYPWMGVVGTYYPLYNDLLQ